MNRDKNMPVVYKLKDCCQIIAGQSPESKYYNTNGEGLPFFQGKADFGALYPKVRMYCSQPTKIAEKDDILLSVRAPVGPTNLSPGKVCIGRGLAAIRPDKKVGLRYLLYFFRYYETQLQRSGTGTTFKAITQNVIKNIEVPVPSIDEQERIVSKIEELFSKLDASVAELQTAKEKLKVYRQAVLKEAFTPGKDWKKLKALDVGEVKLGRQRSPQNVSNLYPTKYIRAANITEQGLDLSDVLEMEFTPTEQSKYTLQENDIVISEASGSPTQVGKPALWKCELQTCCFQNTVIRHRVKEANPEYVFWYYKYLYISGYFSRIVGGVGINHLGAKNFSNIEIPIPSVLDQTKIVQRIERVLSVYGNIEQTIDTSLQQAEALRQSVLKQAFEGGL